VEKIVIGVAGDDADGATEAVGHETVMTIRGLLGEEHAEDAEASLWLWSSVRRCSELGSPSFCDARHTRSDRSIQRGVAAPGARIFTLTNPSSAFASAAVVSVREQARRRPGGAQRAPEQGDRRSA
jgi:hypothetical protein